MRNKNILKFPIHKARLAKDSEAYFAWILDVMHKNGTVDKVANDEIGTDELK